MNKLHLVASKTIEKTKGNDTIAKTLQGSSELELLMTLVRDERLKYLILKESNKEAKRRVKDAPFGKATTRSVASELDFRRSDRKPRGLSIHPKDSQNKIHPDEQGRG